MTNTIIIYHPGNNEFCAIEMQDLAYLAFCNGFYSVMEPWVYIGEL